MFRGKKKIKRSYFILVCLLESLKDNANPDDIPSSELKQTNIPHKFSPEKEKYHRCHELS